MGEAKTPDFERRPPEEGVLWLQDVKSDSSTQVVSPGCMVTVRYRGVSVSITVDAVGPDHTISGVVSGFETRGSKHPEGLHVGQRVQLSLDQVFSCGCAAVS